LSGSGTIIVSNPGKFGTRSNRHLSCEAYSAPMKRVVVLLVVAAVCMGVPAEAQDPRRQSFTPEQLATGADLYARHCSPCHGTRMLDPQGAFDLRKFPRDQRERFVTSVLRGKNQMPPWGDILTPEEVEALWGYVVVGER
jgi:mono/diheme cytochrome c family protein